MARIEPMVVIRRKEKLFSTLLWRIENISYWEPEFYAEVQSPLFQFNNTSGCDLRLCFRGEDKHFACRLRCDEKLSPLDYEWALLDRNGLPVVAIIVRNATVESYQSVDFLDWPTYKDVFHDRRLSFLTNDTLIIRCRFWKSDKSFEKAEYISGFTRIIAAETSFLWRIMKFSSLQLEQELITPFVLQFSDGQIVFKLKFSLKGHSLTYANASFEIILENRTSLVLVTTLSILDQEDITVKSMSSKSAFGMKSHPSQQIRRLPKFLPRQELIYRKSDWLHDDRFALLFQFQSVKKQMEKGIEKSYVGYENMKTEIPRNNPSAPQVTIMEPKITDPTCTTSAVPEQCSQTQCSDSSKIPQHKTKSVASLQEDLLSLYTEHTLTDFELRSGGASIHVHKMVLSYRSPVFKAMFCGEMKEATSDFLDIPDIDVHTLNRMLTFMYTGTLAHLDWESAAKLYYAADKYQVQSLKEECLYLLQSGTTVQNVTDIMELADRHQDKDIELLVHDFIVSHYDEVVLSEEWAKFLNRNGTLAGNVMRDVYKKKLQKDCK